MKDMLKRVNYQELFEQHKVEHVDVDDLKIYQDMGSLHSVSADKEPIPSSERLMLYDVRNETDGILIIDDETFGRLGVFEDIRDDETVACNSLGAYISSRPKEHFQTVFTAMAVAAVDVNEVVRVLNKALAPLNKTIVLSALYGSEVKHVYGSEATRNEKGGNVKSKMLTRSELSTLVRFINASAKNSEKDFQEFDKRMKLNQSYVSLFSDVKKQS